MVKMIVKARELRYGGIQLKQGERFEASEKDVKLLTAIRKAELVKGRPQRKVGGTKPAKALGAYLNRQLKSES